MKADLIELELLIKEKQRELSLLHDDGSVVVAAQLEQEIDDLQKSFTRLKEGQGAGDDNPVESGSSHFTPRELPPLEEQIEFMKQALDPTACHPASTEMIEAIYQSLCACVYLRDAAKTPKKELDEVLIETDAIQRPYDLDTQFRFINLLKGARKENKQLDNLYDGIEQSLCVARWVGQAAADALLKLPSNQPTKSTGTDGDLEIYIQKDVDGSFMATFNDWCESRDIGGEGKTVQEAIASLFEARERAKQEVLFPKEVDGHV